MWKMTSLGSGELGQTTAVKTGDAGVQSGVDAKVTGTVKGGGTGTGVMPSASWTGSVRPELYMGSGNRLRGPFGWYGVEWIGEYMLAY